jgi:ABC-type nickel/cobalt efflux system permease component RcnA
MKSESAERNSVSDTVTSVASPERSQAAGRNRNGPESREATHGAGSRSTAVHDQNESEGTESTDIAASRSTAGPDSTSSRSTAFSDTADSQPTATTENLIKKHNIKDQNIPDSRFLSKTLARLESSLTSDSSIRSLIAMALSVFALGFIHASMAGHGKGILLSYLSQEERKFSHALRFITTFTITHLADVVILSLGLTFFSSSYSSARTSTILKYVGGSGLIVLAVILIIRGIMDIREKPKQSKQPTRATSYKPKNESSKTEGTRGAVLMGLLVGLAPCPFGWAIILLLMSIGKLSMVPVIILIFGLGIFTFLFLVSIGFFIARGVVSKIFEQYARYSQLISGILILIFSLFFFTTKIPTL